MKLTYGVVPAALVLMSAVSLTQVSPPSKAGEDPRARGAAFAQGSPAEFSWLMFLNLVSPAKPGERGVRDPSKSVGAPGATVFETYRNVAGIYLPNGSRPSPWNNPGELPFPSTSKLTPTPAQLKALGPADSTWIHYLSEDRMIDGQQIVNATSEIIRYDVRDNKAAFDYIVNNKAKYELFNLDGQEAALADPKFTFAFPTGALEIKASWKIFGPNDDTSRYWTAYVVYFDLQNRFRVARGGLTGLHFSSKILPNWFWATFEQSDNPTTTFQFFLGKKRGAVGANETFNPAAKPRNDSWDKDLAGTKWAFYQLQGWQMDFVDAGKPTLLANTQIETYFESNSSCITCHSLANIGPPASVRFDFWNMAGGNITGYTGNVNFQQIAHQQFPGVTFKAMDYVWALRQAKPKTK